MNAASLRDGIRVLIVEDSPLTASQICEAIEKVQPEIRCSVVSTEFEALSTIAQFMPQIVVLDLRLKVGTGFGVLNELQTAKQRPVTIVVTNYALPQIREFAFLRGADYFLDKAFSMDELPHILREVIQGPHSRTTSRTN